MKSSEILRRAALRVERGDDFYGCWAIAIAAGRQVSPYEHFMDFFARSKDANRAYQYFRRWIGGNINTGQWWPVGEGGPRIIGLCLAAAIAESEGD